MKTLNQKIEFLDAEKHRARLEVNITNRNGYPEFTVSGQFMGGSGQCLDRIRPANADQAALINLWKEYHLKDVSSMHNFREHLEEVLDRIERAESERAAGAEKLEGDDATLELMEQEGINEDRLGAVKAYIHITGSDDLSGFDEAYLGEYRDDEDFARDTAENMGAIDNTLSWPHTCIDWEQAARELMRGYSEHDGHYFINI